MKISNNKKVNPDMNRRKFFKTGVAIAGGSLIASATGAHRVIGQNDSGLLSKQIVQNTSPTTFPSRRKLGADLEVSSIGLGCQELVRMMSFLRMMNLISSMQN